MSAGTVVVRVVLVGVMPILTTVAGSDPGPAVIILSVLAAVFECVATGLNAAANNNGKKGGGGKKDKNIRPLKSFPLQLAVLYIVQLWFLLLRTAGASPASAAAGPATVEAVVQAANVGAAPVSVMSDLHSDGSAVGLPVIEAKSVAPKKVAPADQVPAMSGRTRPYAKPMGAGYQLDETADNLRWEPKTISVVLPCAEERDFAFKTVQAVFRQTPGHVLHEIVVVDDGSNPPLSETHLTPQIQQQYKVKICRHEETVGLIGAKKTGGDAATGDIVVFFDCHVGPQPNWHEDFLRLVGENYRRMVVPQITALNIDDWTQIGGGGGMSKCYVTWDGDFKWGGTDDMYMGMLSGGLAGLSKRWWTESGGYDTEMLGWGGENIDQGIRMWVCGGEIVAAPNAQVAHMWRTGEARTNARYKRVGDTTKNRARAMYAWMGDFAEKLDDFPSYSSRKQQEGDHWYGDMSNFQKVKDQLQGCHPFGWYLKRFKSVYEDAGLLPLDIYMIREETSGQCLLFQGQAGTSGNGREGIVLAPCETGNHRFYWHPGNRSPKTSKCCSGLRAWNTDQCLEGGQGGGKGVTGICELSGQNQNQHWKLHSDGSLRRGDTCLGPGNEPNSLQESPCFAFRSRGGAKFTKQETHKPIETMLYEKAQMQHPEIFARLDAQFQAVSGTGPRKCQELGVKCVTLFYADGRKRCLGEEAGLTDDPDSCVVIYIDGKTIRNAENDNCLDIASDQDPESYVWYGCHGGANQNFDDRGGKYCASQTVPNGDQCFDAKSWP